MNKFQKQIKKFAKDRNWNQFHNPKDLLLGIVEEVGEIRNLVKWEQDPKKIRKAIWKNLRLEDDIGDMYWFMALLANGAGINIDTAIKKVIEANKKRFPISEIKSRHTNTNLGGKDKKYE